MRINRLKLKLQIECGSVFAFGPGKADLLETIDRTGSISAAARAMNMSYRRAWLLVDEVNRCFSVPLIDTLTGGGRERGARLTGEGRGIVMAFREMESAAAQITEGAAYRHVADKLLIEPRPLRVGKTGDDIDIRR